METLNKSPFSRKR